METVESVRIFFENTVNLPFTSKFESAQILSGGLANFVYRVKFQDGSSVVFKYFAPFLASNRTIEVSQKRYFTEKSALQTLTPQPWLNNHPNSKIRTPKLFYSNDEAFVLIMEDAGNVVTLFNLLLQESTLSNEFVENIPKEIKIFLDYLTNDFGMSPSTNHVFNNEWAWNIFEAYYPALWSSMSKKMNLENELGYFLKRGPELFDRKNDPNAVFVFGDLWPSSILIDQEKNLIWIIDWEMARYETKTRDLEQLLANLWIMKQSKKFDGEKIGSLIRNFQKEFFGDENSDWRMNCDEFAKCNFVLWVVGLLNETHWGVENNSDVARKALEEIKD